MAKVERLELVIKALNKVRDKANVASKTSVIVGYTQAYALHVHENLMARHPVGQAKFLEQPARQLGKVLGEIMAKMMRLSKTYAQALLMAGLRLQRESQLLCPVDTGALRASAFTRLEK